MLSNTCIMSASLSASPSKRPVMLVTLSLDVALVDRLLILDHLAVKHESLHADGHARLVLDVLLQVLD